MSLPALSLSKESNWSKGSVTERCMAFGSSAYENGRRERLTRFTCGTHTPLVIRSRRPLSSAVDRFSAGLLFVA
ncbi:MAG: hypothetical protein ACLFO5_03545 [Opitutales bacterium]